jgi:hypothetical protein
MSVRPIPLTMFWTYDRSPVLTTAPWFEYLHDMLDFLWMGAIDNNLLLSVIGNRKITVTGKDFLTTYIPEGSTATFRITDDAVMRACDDIDNLWFVPGGVQKDVTVGGLIGGDYRTIVKYNNIAPFDIYMIGTIKKGLVLTQNQINSISKDFQLSLLWSGEYNDFGYLKDNRDY